LVDTFVTGELVVNLVCRINGSLWCHISCLPLPNVYFFKENHFERM